jgi:hypothetical protein
VHLAEAVEEVAVVEVLQEVAVVGKASLVSRVVPK